MTQKERLDVLMVERGLAASRNRAQRLIRAGEVLVDDRVFDKPGMQVSVGAGIRVRERLPYVGRGGLKLEAALDTFPIEVSGMMAADVGASTGGFTDCLLQRGAVRVYAIDVGYGQLAWPLRQDERVVVMERTNVRYLDELPDPIDLATVDVSFISLRLVLPKIMGWLTPAGQIVALIKPQFEAGRDDVGKGGIVRDPDVHRRVLYEILSFAGEQGLHLRGLMPSPITGAEGNVEFLAWFSTGLPAASVDVSEAIERVVG
ncbi:MAG: 16S/23S rRNA (cytidine-2'-O)-methyltransferase TlyA [Anaerolineales bacterium]|nr:16S/23S rRNA (cytidine-2'-O)-methyltransferase TlyA [Anaerolineales bacterium]